MGHLLVRLQPRHIESRADARPTPLRPGRADCRRLPGARRGRSSAPGTAGADAPDPGGGPDPERGQDRHALQDRLRHRPRGDRPRLGGALLLAVPLPGPAGGPPTAPSRSAATPPWSWAGRSRASAIVVAITIVTLHLPAGHQGPGRLGPGVGRRGARPERRHQPASSARRQGASRSRSRGSSTCGATSTRTATVSFQRDGRARGHDRDAEDQGQRRRAQLVDPEARRQARRRPRTTRTRPGSRPRRPATFEGQCAEFCGARPRTR